MRKSKKGKAVNLFLRSMIYTAATIALLFVGYFSAKYFLGKI